MDGAGTLLKKFNRLLGQQASLEATEVLQGEWYFDLRYHFLPPTTFHFVFLANIPSGSIRIVPLVDGDLNIPLFPESVTQAAAPVAKAIMYAFLYGPHQHLPGHQGQCRVIIPSKFSTAEEGLAAAVGEEFKALGVVPHTLHDVQVATKSVLESIEVIEQAYDNDHEFFEQLLDSNSGSKILVASGATVASVPVFFFDSVAHSGPHPTAINFFDPNIDPKFLGAMKYAEQMFSSRPLKEYNDVKPSLWTSQVGPILQLVRSKPEIVLKVESQVNAFAALDYGVRLLVGLGCTADRASSREYLLRAIALPGATEEVQATAHGILVDWYTFRYTHVFMVPAVHFLSAAYHAEMAANLCRRISPSDVPAPPAVLRFMSEVFEPYTRLRCPQLAKYYKDATYALRFKRELSSVRKERLAERKMNNPNRYHCATAGCAIQADEGLMLSRCAGKCDLDKKPYYCSKTCQKADWKNHKPFCKPDAPSSVLAKEDPSKLNGVSPFSGVFSLPIRGPSGRTSYVSVSGCSGPEPAKAILELVAEGLNDDEAVDSGPFHFEMTGVPKQMFAEWKAQGLIS